MIMVIVLILFVTFLGIEPPSVCMCHYQRNQSELTSHYCQQLNASQVLMIVSFRLSMVGRNNEADRQDSTGNRT